MAAITSLPKSPDIDLIRGEIETVLGAEMFLRAPSLAQFLSYVCNKALNGEADQIKEYNIAVEAFGRQPDFDQKEDAIVRVEAHRLRKRLKHYYEHEGRNHSVHIVIPSGHYAPNFVYGPAEARPHPVPEAVPARSTPDAGPSRRRFWRAAAAVLAAIAAIAGVALIRRAGSPVPPFPGTTEGARGAAVASGDEGLRIACGMAAPKYVDLFGFTWLGDRYFTGGKIVSSPADSIRRAQDPALFQSRREGDFRYDIPLEPGVYEMHLLFAERMYGPGNIAGGGETSRLFHVFVNGEPILREFDVISDADGGNTADERVFKDIRPAADSFLHVRFSRFKELPFVNGIVIQPGEPGRMRPVRMTAGNTRVKDAAGRLWQADRYFVGGQSIVRSAAVTGTKTPEIHRTERYGHFNYSIPVAEGRYRLTLYFAETWFGPSKPSQGGQGSRLFDVYCNGAALLRSFDVYRAAGGSDRAVEKTFRGLTPNSQGKLNLAFVPVKNYATLNAIEVVAE